MCLSVGQVAAVRVGAGRRLGWHRAILQSNAAYCGHLRLPSGVGGRRSIRLNYAILVSTVRVEAICAWRAAGAWLNG